jgi:hypothetical protein
MVSGCIVGVWVIGMITYGAYQVPLVVLPALPSIAGLCPCYLGQLQDTLDDFQSFVNIFENST